MLQNTECPNNLYLIMIIDTRLLQGIVILQRPLFFCQETGSSFLVI